MRLSLLSALLLGLAGCEQAGALGGDGYRFEQNSKRLNDRTITVVTHPTREHMLAAHPKLKNKETGGAREIQAFTLFSEKGTTCTIHIVDPAVRYDPAFFGHELTHCLYGQFHPSQA